MAMPATLERDDPRTWGPDAELTTRPPARLLEGVGSVVFTFRGVPGGLATDGRGALLVSDARSATIWRLAPGAAPVALPVGPAARDSASGGGERLAHPAGMSLAPDGTLYIAEPNRHRICAVSPDGDLRVVAGGANGYRDGRGADALFRFPTDVAVAADGTCYVADTANDRIRTITPDGTVRTIAGSIYDYGDGRGPLASFRRPGALAVAADGACYVADTGNSAIRRVCPDGEVTTLAGGPPGGSADLADGGVALRGPSGIALDTDASIWVADHGNAAVRRIDRHGRGVSRLRLGGPPWPSAVLRLDPATVAIAGSGVDDDLAPFGWVGLLDTARSTRP